MQMKYSQEEVTFPVQTLKGSENSAKVCFHAAACVQGRLFSEKGDLFEFMNRTQAKDPS